MSKELDTAIIAAKKAGKVLLKHFKTELKITQKLDKSFVTNADLESEKTILEIITNKFPHHSFYSEEKGKSKNSSEYCWYIDPLDGTHNFLHKFPMFGVSISLAKNNEFIVGVIYLPLLDELFYAEKDKGAYLNKKRIKVSKTNLKDSFALLPSSYLYSGESFIKIAKLIVPLCADTRMICCCCMKLSYIACGRADFAILPRTTAYDSGAGVVLLREAGGKITDIKGDVFTSTSYSNGFIASNNIFHKKLVEIMKKEGF